MARISGVAKGQESWIVRFANRYSKKKVGVATEPVAIMGHQPWLLASAGAYEMGSQRQTSVPTKLKTLVGIKAAMMIGCPF